MCLYYSPKSGRMRWAFHVAHVEERKGAYRVLVRKPDGKRPLGRPRRRLEDYIKVELQEVRWVTDWIDLAQDRDRWRAIVNAVMKFWIT